MYVPLKLTVEEAALLDYLVVECDYDSRADCLRRCLSSVALHLGAPPELTLEARRSRITCVPRRRRGAAGQSQ